MKQESVYVPRAARLTEVLPETEMEKTFVFELLDGEDFSYGPGQFILVTVFSIGEAPFAVSSGPEPDGLIQITVRRYPGGRVTEALHELESGEYIGVRGPFGNGFPLERLRGGDLLVVAGGIGMAPLCALIQSVLSEREQYRELIVLYGMRSPGEMLFKDLMRQWEESDEIDLRLTIDQPHPDWDGNVGMVTELSLIHISEPTRPY